MSSDSWRAAAIAVTIAPMFVMHLQACYVVESVGALLRRECELFREPNLSAKRQAALDRGRRD